MQFIKPTSKPQKRARILIIVMMIALGTGIISAFENNELQWRDLVGNLSTEIIGGILTFGLIDRYITHNEDEATYKRQLISKLENHDTGIVKQVLQELKANDWLEDGSLYGWFLKKANFEGLQLKHINTNGLGLYRCNLKGAEIEDKQLVQLNDLRLTIMPDGNLYDGRYCLLGDIEWANTKFGIDFMEASVEQLADYYGIPTDAFIAGQQWAFEHLEKDFGVEIPSYIYRILNIT